MIIGVLIFSRYASNRLPGKALKKIDGQELLGRVIDRSKTLVGIEGIAVATSGNQIDDKLADFSAAKQVGVFRGDENDVAKRAIDACAHYGWDAFVRVCGDRPFFDPSIVNSAVEIITDKDCDLVTTSGSCALPPGLTTEIISLSALERVYGQFDVHDKEHISSYIYKHAASFDIRYLNYPSISKAVYPTTLAIDTEKDLQRATWISKQLNSQDKISGQSAKSLLELAMDWDSNYSTCANETSLEEKR